MKHTILIVQGLAKGLITLAICACYGCISATTSNPPPVAIFTKAAETAVAQSTIIALTPLPPTYTDVPGLSEDGASVPQQTLAASMSGTVVSPSGQTGATPTTTDSSQPTNTPTVALSATPTQNQQNTPTAANIGAACIPANPPQAGKVLDILDGDTIKVMIDGKTYIVRYIGINAPEYIKTKEYYGTDAWLKNSELVFAKDITLFKDGPEVDAFGRLLRYVKVGDTFVNLELVRLGFAKTAPGGACDSVFQTVQDQASASKIGLWGKP